MKQYFRYFRIWFILFGVCALVTLVVGIRALLQVEEIVVRGNTEAPHERVYDYAEVLSDSEEIELRRRIAEVEEQVHFDVVLVTINESLLDKYGYTENTDENWDTAITVYADDFYDYKYYGYNEPMGDGVILVDNWYEGEMGSKFSTAGAAVDKYTYSMVEEVLDAVYYYVEENPFAAYMGYVNTVARQLAPQVTVKHTITMEFVLLIALIPSIIFVVVHIKNKEGKKTTTTGTYVDEKAVVPRFIVNRDDFITKSVSKVRINTDSGSHGSSRSGGGGAGRHRSSSGRSHGGGSRRR